MMRYIGLLLCLILCANPVMAVLDINDPSFESCTGDGDTPDFWSGMNYCNSSVHHSGSYSLYRNMTTAMALSPDQANASWGTIPAGTEYGFWYKAKPYGTNCTFSQEGTANSNTALQSPLTKHTIPEGQIILDNTWRKYSNTSWQEITSSPTLKTYMYARKILPTDTTCSGIELWMDDFFPSTHSIYSDVPIADFEAIPNSSISPRLIALNDKSTGGTATAWNWSGSGPGTMWWGPVNTQHTTVYLSTPGNYTVTHCAENSGGSDCETKPDYIWIYDDNSTVTTEFVTIDAIGGAAILNASVSLRDVENSSWTNSSTNAMGSAYITTLVGHTINAYASAIGFKDNDLLGVEAAGPPQGYAILMQPKGYFNVSEGYVTLYVSVFDDGTSEPISGASVTVAKSNGMAELWQTTNAAGIATFPVENETDFIAQASKAGYSTASKGVNSGTGSGGDATVSVNIWLAKGTVTPTTTMTAGPGGTVPVTQDPYLSLSPEEKQSALATDVMNYGPMLVNFFILLTIVGGFKMITK